MTISVGANTQGANATSASSLSIGSLTPDAGSDKRIIAVGFQHNTVPNATGALSATFGGSAMSKIAELDDDTDPSRTLAVFEHRIGSSTAAGTISFSSTTNALWCGIAFVLIGVPDDAEPIFNMATSLAALGLDFSAPGVLIDVAAVNSDSSATSDNVITIDGSQTLIRQQSRGVGGNNEGRLTVSCKSVAGGAQSGASSSPYSDGVAHIVVGYEEAGGGGAVLTPAGAMHGGSAAAALLRVRLGAASAWHAGAAGSAALRPRLGTASALHGQGASSPALALAGQLGIASARHAHAALPPMLDSAGLLGPQGAALPHGASSPVLSTAFVPPGVNGPVLKIGAERRAVCIRPDARVLNVHAA